MVLSVVLSVFLVSSVQGRLEYLQRIPNAYSVKTQVSKSICLLMAYLHSQM